MNRLLTLLALATLVALPAATAMSHGDSNDDAAPSEVDVDVTADDNDPEESTFAGMSTTVVIVLVVLAILVIALVVALAARGP